jgi:two-component system cell cycle response regulator DivK
MTAALPAAVRALVVDDNPINAELASFVLQSDGFEVETAGDAEEALQRIDTFRPRVVLMDIQLPGLDGLALTRLLKSRSDLPPTVLIAFTACAMKGDESRMRAAGCDGYIAKPIDVATFARQVRGCIGLAADDREPSIPRN